MSRLRRTTTGCLVLLGALALMAVSAAACGGGGGGGKEPTTLSTSLSGEGKEGGEITVLEGAKVKDKATLSGKNASKASGKVKYDVYSEKECKTLVTAAGEGTVSGTSVTASSEESLEAGRTYYWQATYEGNSENSASSSTCTSEVLNVKAATSLSTKLSGESSEGSEITVLEGAKAKDKATLSGTNSSSAGGKVLYKIYSDKECKTLVKEAGEVTVSSGSVPTSSEEELEGGKTYYWQATYKGDGLHQESSSSCGGEVLKVKAKTTLATTLSGEGEEGDEITIPEGAKAKDKATVEGTNSSTAEGQVLYEIYSDSKCEHLVTSAGEKSVSSGSAGASNEEELEGAKTYYWQATYKGDGLHQESKSTCGKEVLTVKAKTTLTTTLSGEGKEDSELTVLEGAKVKDDATLGGSHSSSAGGKVAYKVYSDSKCEHLVATAGEETVSSGSVPSSSEEEPEGGKTYYWQATYKGDSLHQESTSECGKEVLKVKAKTTLATTLSGGGKEGAEITINEGSKAKDKATVEGTNSSTAEGKVLYKIYSDSKCEDLVAEAGDEGVSSGAAAASSEEELEGGKTYYWQATYEGDSLHQESTSECGSEVLGVKAKTTLITTLSGEGKEGAELTTIEGAKAKDTATLEGTNAATASGKVTYKIYSDKECKDLVTTAGEDTVSSGSVPGSSEEELEGANIYYWQASYDGDSLHDASTSECGKEVLTVKAKTTLSTTLSGEGKEGSELTVLEGSKVKDDATLGGSHSSSAGGEVAYKVYSDSKCEHLVATAGEETVSSGSVPSSSEEEPEGGKTYYWQATYKGDSLHQESTSECGAELLNVKAKTTLTTELSGEGKEGKTITVLEGAELSDHAALSGTAVSTATGIVTYAVYSDSECKDLVSSAEEVAVTSGNVPASKEESLKGASVYYWQATYSGDSLHTPSTSACGTEIATVKAATTVSTSLSGEGQSGEEVGVEEGVPIEDTATLSGVGALFASGKLTYKVYSDPECTQLVAESSEIPVSGELIAPSGEQTLAPGIYYWQATYSGDALNQGATSACGEEISFVNAGTTVTTSLTGEGQEGEELEALEGAKITDTATLQGQHAEEATGTIKYFIYSDSECTHLYASAGEVSLSGETAPKSNEEELPVGTYYWQAAYSGDAHNPPATSACGDEITTVGTPTYLTTSLTGGGHTGEEITVAEETTVRDSATLSGSHASEATGSVEYAIYSNSECTELYTTAGVGGVSGTEVEPSTEVTLPPGTYYWQAVYSGAGINRKSASACGSEVTIVTPSPLTTSLSGGGQYGPEIELPEETMVSDTATLSGPYASEATGEVTYTIYSNSNCTELFSKAGGGAVSGGEFPSSSEIALPPGTYYWQASYTGDAKNPEAKSRCGSEQAVVKLPNRKYAALGDSFSAGLGIAKYYDQTNTPSGTPAAEANECTRSRKAWPARVAEALFGKAATLEGEVLRQQPTNFIFRACQGAVIENLWGKGVAGGQYNEWIEGAPGEWLPKPAQDLWLQLPGGKPPTMPITPNNAIEWVTLTIGGNDSGFAQIGENCVKTIPQVPQVMIFGQAFGPAPYSRSRCKTIIKEFETGKQLGPNILPPKPSTKEGIPSIERKLKAVLTNIHESAPKAKIRVPLYPQLIDTGKWGGFRLGTSRVNLTSLRTNFNKDVSFSMQASIAWELRVYVATLNKKIKEVVKKWKEATGANAEAVSTTEKAFDGHEIGDATPWVNALVFGPPYGAPGRESFHPNCLGHIALAKAVLKNMDPAASPPAWKC